MTTLNSGMQALLINKGYTSNSVGTGMLDLINASPNAVRRLNQFAAKYRQRGQVFHYEISTSSQLHNPANTRIVQLKVFGQLRHSIILTKH